MTENLEGKKVEVLPEGTTGEVVEHIPDLNEVCVSYDKVSGIITVKQNDVRPLDEILYECPDCGNQFTKKELEDLRV